MARKARIPAAGSGFARTLWPFPQRSGGAKVVRRSRRRRASISRSAYKKLVRELPNHFVLAYCWGAARLRQPRTPRHEALGKPNRGRSQRQAAAAFHGERTNRCTRRNRILRTTLRHSQARQQAWTRRSASRCSPCCATVKVWKYMTSRANGQQPCRTGLARSRGANCRSVTGAQLAGLLFSVHI